MKFRNLCVFLLIMISLFVTGCGNKTKEVATLDDFMNIASNKGLTVSDNIEVYETVNYILEAKVAVDDDLTIEMIKYSDEDYAEKAQDNHIESFNLLRSTGAHEVKDKGNNYYGYELVSNGRYMFSIRVDNTLIFGKVLLEDKELTEELLNDLGY